MDGRDLVVAKIKFEGTDNLRGDTLKGPASLGPQLVPGHVQCKKSVHIYDALSKCPCSFVLFTEVTRKLRNLDVVAGKVERTKTGLVGTQDC